MDSNYKGGQMFPKKKIKQTVNVVLFGLSCEHPKFQRISVYDPQRPYIDKVLQQEISKISSNPNAPQPKSPNEKDLLLMQSLFSQNQFYKIKIVNCFFSRNSEYDKENLLKVIEQAFNDTDNNNDKFCTSSSVATLLYFSCQGEKDTGSLLFQDTQGKIDKLSFQEVYDLWEKRTSQQQLCHIILDSSYSGFWVQTMKTQHNTNYSFSVYSCCGEKQISRDCENGGIFTQNLVVALSDDRNNASQLNDAFEKKNVQNAQFFGMQYKVYDFFGMPLFFSNNQKMMQWMHKKGAVEEIQQGRLKGDKYLGEFVYVKKQQIADMVQSALILEKKSNIATLNNQKNQKGDNFNKTSNDGKSFMNKNASKQQRLQSADQSERRGRRQSSERANNSLEKTKNRSLTNNKTKNKKSNLKQKKPHSSSSASLQKTGILQKKNSSTQNPETLNQQTPSSKQTAVQFNTVAATLFSSKNSKINNNKKLSLKPSSRSPSTPSKPPKKVEKKKLDPSEDKKNYTAIKEGHGSYFYFNIIRKYNTEHKYEGEWQKNLKSGLGTMYFPNGDVYEGEWAQDLMHGFGFFYHFSSGDVYQGCFVLGKKHGHGVMHYGDGDKYEGEYFEGEMHGQQVGSCKYFYKNGDLYEGQFVHGMKQGIGIYTYSNGDKYEGEWKKGKKDGAGVFWWNGQGKYTGDRYEGTWKKGVKQGKGVYFFANGDKFQGQWQNDQMTGQGTFTWADDGQVYVGEFREDLRCGKGKLLFNNGEQQVGYFKQNCPMGRHLVIGQEGKVKEKKEFGHQPKIIRGKVIL